MSQAGRRADDLGHDLAQVVVGLVDDELARGAVAAVEQVLDPVELGGRAEVLRRARAGGRAGAARAPSSPTRSLDGQVDELAVEAVARGQPLVLVEHLPRVVARAACPPS